MDYNDYNDAFAQLRDLLDGLAPTDKTIDEIDELRELWEDIVGEKHVGSAPDVLHRLKESFGENDETIPVQPDWSVEVKLSLDVTSANRFVVVFWRIIHPSGGSLNLPYIIQRRSESEFEITMPLD